MKLFLGIALLSTLITTTLVAEDLRQPRGRNWLALASSPDKNVAIGIARHVGWEEGSVRVVQAGNGYYAVVTGPYAATDIGQFKRSAEAKKFSVLPSDALLSDGTRYVETVWPQAGVQSVGFQNYSMSKPVEFSSGEFQVKISAEKLGAENAYTKIEGHDAEGSFHFDIGKDLPLAEQDTAEAMSSENYYRAAVVRLIPVVKATQLIVTQFTGGAHCCTVTYVIGREQNAEAWSMIKLDPRDGVGFSYDDVDGDGAKEFVGVDNAFLYTFDCYACSYAPVQIYKWREGKIDDVSLELGSHARLVQDLAGMEWDAKLQPDLLKSNGYLAGWVASKIRLGQGDEAWRVFMQNYDRQNTFGPQICTTGQKVDDCPDGKLQPVPLPKALAQFLRDNGYTPLPKEAEKELN